MDTKEVLHKRVKNLVSGPLQHDPTKDKRFQRRIGGRHAGALRPLAAQTARPTPPHLCPTTTPTWPIAARANRQSGSASGCCAPASHRWNSGMTTASAELPYRLTCRTRRGWPSGRRVAAGRDHHRLLQRSAAYAASFVAPAPVAAPGPENHHFGAHRGLSLIQPGKKRSACASMGFACDPFIGRRLVRRPFVRHVSPVA